MIEEKTDDAKETPVIDLSALIAEMRRLNEPRLWDAQDIANYLNLAKSTVQSHILCKPDFPRAIMVNRTRRWNPPEVYEWALRSRERA